MSSYSIEERVFKVEEYFLSNVCVITVQKRFKNVFKVENSPNYQTIMDHIENFRETASVNDE